ncbi:MAG: hypothetical protein WBC44_03825 [Planctomycetaceae bacterium]
MFLAMARRSSRAPDDDFASAQVEWRDRQQELSYCVDRLQAVAAQIQAGIIEIPDDAFRQAKQYWENYGGWQGLARAANLEDEAQWLSRLDQALQDSTTILVAVGQLHEVVTDPVRLGTRTLIGAYDRRRCPTEVEKQNVREALNAIQVTIDARSGHQLRQRHQPSNHRIEPSNNNAQRLEVASDGKHVLDKLRRAADAPADDNRPRKRRGRLLRTELGKALGVEIPSGIY